MELGRSGRGGGVVVPTGGKWSAPKKGKKEEEEKDDGMKGGGGVSAQGHGGRGRQYGVKTKRGCVTRCYREERRGSYQS